MITNRNINGVIRKVRREVRKWEEPAVERAARGKRDPFRVLIGCVLSLRTKDETTAVAAGRLFALAQTPEEMLRLRARTIERAIYPVGFYRNKARSIREIARALIDKHEERVPNTMEGLLELKGVGRKTANLVLTRGFDQYGICVDIHVHRITNRWGYVRTNSPNETEMALREKLPRRHWKTINRALVVFGQKVCRPVSPFCSLCPVAGACARNGVTRSR